MQRYRKEILGFSFLCTDVELCNMSGPLMTGKGVVQGSGAVSPRCGHQWLFRELGPYSYDGADMLWICSCNLSRMAVVRLPL
jgi:hypothetical protein